MYHLRWKFFWGFSFPLYVEHYLEGFVVALEKSLTSSTVYQGMKGAEEMEYEVECTESYIMKALVANF